MGEAIPHTDRIFFKFQHDAPTASPFAWFRDEGEVAMKMHPLCLTRFCRMMSPAKRQKLSKVCVWSSPKPLPPSLENKASDPWQGGQEDEGQQPLRTHDGLDGCLGDFFEEGMADPAYTQAIVPGSMPS